MILLATIPEACLSYLALGGVFALGGALGYAICTILDRDPTGNVTPNLITNGEALEMIHRFRAGVNDDTASGHIELGVLLGYIELIKSKCSAVGKDLSGLEYYFAKYGPGPSGSTAITKDSKDNRNTLVIYPTFKDAAGDFIPFDPSVSTTTDIKRVVDLNDSTNWSNRANLGGMYDTEAFVLNRLHMSPPRNPDTL